MILGALIEELAKRFQHEKRARVCLWFDEKREFEGLLDKLQARLSSTTPPPFSLLRYDPKSFHGQIWIKDQVRRSGAVRRFVVYLPLGEDRLSSPDARGGHHLEMLEEYRVAGIVWRLKRASTSTKPRTQSGGKAPGARYPYRSWTMPRNSARSPCTLSWSHRRSKDQFVCPGGDGLHAPSLRQLHAAT